MGTPRTGQRPSKGRQVHRPPAGQAWLVLGLHGAWWGSGHVSSSCPAEPAWVSSAGGSSPCPSWPASQTAVRRPASREGPAPGPQRGSLACTAESRLRSPSLLGSEEGLAVVSYGEWAGEKRRVGVRGPAHSLLGMCTEVGGKPAARNQGYSRSTGRRPEVGCCPGSGRGGRLQAQRGAFQAGGRGRAGRRVVAGGGG